jgi:hypothetical protein
VNAVGRIVRIYIVTCWGDYRRGVVDVYNYLIRCSFVASTDVVLYPVVLLGMD